jgi:hypothetical protein
MRVLSCNNEDADGADDADVAASIDTMATGTKALSMENSPLCGVSREAAQLVGEVVQG